jgi:hypothetical protein
LSLSFLKNPMYLNYLNYPMNRYFLTNHSSPMYPKNLMFLSYQYYPMNPNFHLNLSFLTFLKNR